MTTFTIGAVAKNTSLTTKTIRFYEQAGVISPATRAENGYRHYSKDTITELKLIKSARDLGLPLTEIKKLMSGCHHGSCTHSADYLEQTITDYLALLTEKITQLTTLRDKMAALKHHHTACCDLLHQLISPNERG